MDAKSLAIKTANAHQSVIDAAEKIATHFGFTAEIEDVRSAVFNVKQPHLAQVRQSEAVAAMLSTIADHLEAVEKDKPKPVADKRK